MPSLTLAELKGTVDFGIITIREDEYEAVLQRFPGENNTEGKRNYRISDIPAGEGGKILRVAVLRTNGKGQREAQSAAADMITDLAPKCLFAVGIAGGIPDQDFSLGDVVIATHILDFSVEAVQQDGIEYDVKGFSIPKRLKNMIVSLKSHEEALGSWASDPHIPTPRPAVDYRNPERYYGPPDWREKVYKSLERRFEPGRPARPPKVLDGQVASSDRLIKNVEITEKLLSFVRSTRAVEMEVAGIYQAGEGTTHNYPLTTIRGISDIIGFDRDEDWTKYACQSAAAFTFAFIKSGLLIAPQRIREKGGLITPPVEQIRDQDKPGIIRQRLETILEILKATRSLLGRYVNVRKCDEAVENFGRIKAEFSQISQMLNTGERLPDTLLPFHDAFLVAFGLRKEDALNSIIEKIRYLRSILRTQAKDRKRIEIQSDLDKIIQTINELTASYLS